MTLKEIHVGLFIQTYFKSNFFDTESRPIEAVEIEWVERELG